MTPNYKSLSQLNTIFYSNEACNYRVLSRKGLVVTECIRWWLYRPLLRKVLLRKGDISSKSICLVCLFLARQPPSGPGPPHSWGFLDYTQRRTTVGRTPLDKWSARRRDLYLTTHITYKKQTSMSPVGFKTLSAGERPQTYALDRAATGTGIWFSSKRK